MLPTIAKARLTRLRTQQTSTKKLSLLDYVPKISPELERPDHLAPYAEILESCCPSNENPGGICVVVAAPPQHGKTELTLRALLWWATWCPGKRHAYITYNETKAESVARQFQMLAEQAGLEPTGTLDEVWLKGGTVIRFTSIQGSLTGFPVDGVCIFDDPIKGPVDAQSATVRQRCIDFFDSVAWARRHRGTSFIIMATRWHPGDLSGVLIKRGWKYINLKAIAEGAVNDNGVVEDDPCGRKPGEALWPSRKPPEFFDTERKNIFWWAALYQGSPRPRGGSVFNAEPPLYNRLPDKGYRGAFGLDLAYSKKTSADWSILLEIWRVETDDPKRPHYFIVDVQRKQVKAPEFALTLKAKRINKPWRMRWYAAGPEKGSADFLKKEGIPINDITPKGDKFVRSTGASAAWNDSRIFVPDPEFFDCPWLPDFLTVVQGFTGVNDEHDDDVDALAAGFDEVNDGVGRMGATVIRRGSSL